MKLRDEVSSEKLRGGFYTPPLIVDACYRRIGELLPDRRLAEILEPSAGDGAFLRGGVKTRFDNPRITCVELIPGEAAKCRRELRACGLEGTVVNRSFFSWAENKKPTFDVVVGNPPFVRYQFIPQDERSQLAALLSQGGKDLHGVSNLWIPFTLISLELLGDQGAFALVLPSELLAIKSAGLIRSELIRHYDNLTLEMYPRGSFPGILQDVMVVSGVRDVRTKSGRTVQFREHASSGERRWSHQVTDAKSSWTRFLLSKKQLTAYDAAKNLQEMHRLGEVASIGVSIVTGANDFFTVSEDVLSEYDLKRWALPLLGRTAESPGIVLTQSDLRNARKIGKKSWILDFSADRPDPMKFAGPRKYLALGEELELPGRYKCRIRDPWYRVPDVRYDSLMLSKRAHQSHRLILNQAKAHSTDTIYRGRMKRPFGTWKRSLIAGFHNSVSILSSEIEGRSYGGGVLELVPSEIAEVAVPLVNMDLFLESLDKTCRQAGGQTDASDTLILATDEVLCSLMPPLAKLLPDLVSARLQLRSRRFNG